MNIGRLVALFPEVVRAIQRHRIETPDPLTLARLARENEGLHFLPAAARLRSQPWQQWLPGTEEMFTTGHMDLPDVMDSKALIMDALANARRQGFPDARVTGGGDSFHDMHTNIQAFPRTQADQQLRNKFSSTPEDPVKEILDLINAWRGIRRRTEDYLPDFVEWRDG